MITKMTPAARLAKQARDRTYSKENRAKKLANWRRWIQANPHKAVEYYEKGKDKMAIAHRKWKSKNVVSVRYLRRQYYARKRNASGTHTYEQWMARVEYYGWRCAYCLTVLNSVTLTQDHIIPVSKGGSNWASNLVPACKPCNCKKNAKRKWPIHLESAILAESFGAGRFS